MAPGQLQQLAGAYGVQTAYYDIAGRRQQSSPESVLAVLQALGAPCRSLPDVPDALRERRQAVWRRAIEPVAVAWDGGPAEMDLRLPDSPAGGPVSCTLQTEQGEARSWRLEIETLPIAQRAEVEGIRCTVRRLTLPGGLPPGYHRLTVELPGRLATALVISAPTRAYAPPERSSGSWGVFLPLYALHSRRSLGAGDFADLERLISWVSELGGSFVATLPLLATFLDQPYDPSPYAPISRLFWNELYVDLAAALESTPCPEARAVMEAPTFQRAGDSLRASPQVDYRGQMALKRQVLEQLARCAFAHDSGPPADFPRWAASSPLAEEYARFRATAERLGTPWPRWPQRLRDGDLRPGDYDEDAHRYHLYAQWLAAGQVRALSVKARAHGPGLYLDLPLGVHPDGFDVWRERQQFALGVSAGSPPDGFFTRGQSWGFPPLHPEWVREDGYRYCIAFLRHHLQHAGLLRIDHVMGLHRLFWVPNGMQPRHGAYVRYRAEELYAILSLESHRHRSLIVGENLGTVPSYVNRALSRHGIAGMWVGQFQVSTDPHRALGPLRKDSVASLNTHDVPTFAAFWRGLDLEDRLSLGLLDKAGVRRERRSREAMKRALVSFLVRRGELSRAPSEEQVMQGWLAFLGASPARMVLVNLEDLWLETLPQNTPGTGAERPNWLRKARYTLESFRQMPQVQHALRAVDRHRREGPPKPLPRPSQGKDTPSPSRRGGRG